MQPDLLPWLDREFGWSEDTAERYIRVAKAFHIPDAAEFGGLTIDATALYVLSAPGVPRPARDEAIERAAQGEHITKREADEMVKKAQADQRAELEEMFRQELEKHQASRERELAKAIRQASQEIH